MAARSKHILITGGTGFIGAALCQKLLAEKYTLSVLSRNPKKAAKILGKDVNIIEDMEHDNIKHVDIIINLAGEEIDQYWSAPAKRKIIESRLKITRQIIEFITKQKKKPELLISGSAVGYYGADKNLEFTEDENIFLEQEKLLSKSLCRSWENEAKKAEELGVRVCTTRFGVVLGKDSKIIRRLGPIFSKGLGGKIGDGEQWLSWVHHDDVISAILFIIQNKKIKGGVNVTSPNPVTNSDFSQELAAQYNKPCFCFVPKFLIELFYGQMAKEILLRGQKVFPKRLTENGFKFKYDQLNKALKASL